MVFHSQAVLRSRGVVGCSQNRNSWSSLAPAIYIRLATNTKFRIFVKKPKIFCHVLSIDFIIIYIFV